MSSVVIAGNTSGSVTLAAPDVAGTTTLTLPATSGAVALTSQIPPPSAGSGSALITSSQSWTVPEGVTSATVTCYGGGGGGNRQTASSGTIFNGGKAGVAQAYVTNLSGSIEITVGSGGDRGQTGGTSSFGSYVTATGGSGASASANGSDGSGSVSGATAIRLVTAQIGMSPISGVGKQNTDTRVYTNTTVEQAGYNGTGYPANGTYGVGGCVYIQW